MASKKDEPLLDGCVLSRNIGSINFKNIHVHNVQQRKERERERCKDIGIDIVYISIHRCIHHIHITCTYTN